MNTSTDCSDSILLVDDDPASIHIMGRILSGMGRLLFATNGTDALRLAREMRPDLIVLDAEMPGLSGFEVCEAIKADPLLAHVPVIFVTSHGGPEFEISGFAHGAADFIAKPVSAPLVQARVRTQLRVKHLTDQLRRLATVDALTGLANRRCFDETLAQEWLRARRSGGPMSLLMVDVDHFKRYNDHYGHPAGDACLQAVARALSSACERPADLTARYGGEEFVLLLPDTARAGAATVARRVLAAVEAMALPHAGAPERGVVSVSVGIGCHDEDSACWSPASAGSRFAREASVSVSVEHLLAAADGALYAAKRGGRARAMLLDVADHDATPCARAVAHTAPPHPEVAAASRRS